MRVAYVVPLGDGRYELRFPEVLRQVVRIGIGQVREMVVVGHPAIERLFPPAHPDRPELEEEWRQMMAGELIESRLAAFDVVEESLDATEIDQAQLERWMQGVNAARLALGTILDVSEDDEGTEPPDPDSGEAALEELYDLLSLVLGHLTAAAIGGLPDR